jgi:hypothetical protein
LLDKEVLPLRKKEMNETLRTGKRVCYRMNNSALSCEDMSYLLGLFFADGCLYKKRKTSKTPTGLNWTLQGDEDGLATKLVALLRRADLNPHVYFSRKWSEIIVAVNAVNLTEAFSVKTNLLDQSAAWKFFEHKELLNVRCGIPFVAGLIDGDGTCRVTYRLRRKSRGGLGSIESQWSFSQNRFRCLCEYLHRFILTLTASGSTYGTYHRRRKKKESVEHVVSISKSGIAALLKHGIGDYSWKVERWQHDLADLQNRLSLIRSSVHTVGQVARSLGLNKVTVWAWCKTGKVKTVQSGNGAWYLIPSKEVERLLESQNASSSGRLAQKLGVSVGTVSRWCRAGKVRTLCGGKRRKYLIPVEEVQFLFEQRRRE